MLKNGTLLIFLIVGIIACKQPTELPFMQNADYDADRRLLIVRASDHPDTVLQQIIHLSKTRHEGYGIVLAFGNETPDSQLNSWVRLFWKQDINAVHPIRIDRNNFKNADRVALEGARFIWIFDSPEILRPELQIIFKDCLKKMTRKEGILITDSALKPIVDQMIP
jgi:hypothetical protein